MLVVRRMVSQDVPAVVAIVESLPECFTEDAAWQVGCASHDTWVLTDSDQIAGFAVTEQKSAGRGRDLVGGRFPRATRRRDRNGAS
jgi:hypothetical protein